MISTIVWDVTPCSPVEYTQQSACFLIHTYHMFDPEDGSTFLRNVIDLLLDYTTSHTRSQYALLFIMTAEEASCPTSFD
jgi:hypothetical protein